MKILIIRHGDPDYSIDSLTEKGWHEAELLADRIINTDIKAFYVSPLGRAKDTFSPVQKRSGRCAEVHDWLREFPVRIDDRPVTWDMLPEDWTNTEEYYDRNAWCDVPIMSAANMRAGIEKVAEGLDAVIERHGYKREKNIYRAVSPNEDTIAFFCHFGVQCVMLGHLLGISPMVLWHGTIAAPTSVTTLTTEERREGIAAFRLNSFGDISHLYANGEEPAFAGRFCEMFSNKEQRHN